MKEKQRESKRMTSITRKLHWMLIIKKICLFLFADFFWCASMFFMVLFTIELTANGGLYKNVSRGFIRAEKVYEVLAEDGAGLLHVNVQPLLRIFFWLCISFGALGIVLIIGSFRGEHLKIMQVLQPINEIALRADELGRMSFSEDKYQLIEDAITRIQPQDQETLQFGDRDLQGIEAAMNNLLLRIRDANRQQARFVNDASHELRTPIAVIQGYANMLDRWGKTDPKILDESISAIKTEADHMKRLVEQLLFLARGDSGRTELKLEEISMYQLTQEIYEESILIDEAHIYRWIPSEEDILLKIDVALIKQAVRILLDNAGKYTPAGGEITLSFGRNEETLPYIQVQDQGSGMSEQDVPHIFERFYRSDETRSKAGTGLGLSIAKWIADKHHAYYEVLSRSHVGTRIRLIFTEEN